MEPLLPHDVIYRPKTGFGLPLRRCLQHELQPLVHDVLSPQRLQQRGLFEATAVQGLLHQTVKGVADHSYTLLSLLAIELWCQTYLDGT